MNDQVLFRVIKLIAENCFDGHFTIMKFTTNWRVSFGEAPTSRDDIDAMPVGATLLDAFVKSVESAEWPEAGSKRTIKAV
jgi:hypothetical protein